jgi:type II secretion system protein J
VTGRARGFTLIEVLVGIALLSAFLGGVYTVAIGTLQAKKKIQELAAVYTAGPKILDIVDRDIRFTYIYGVKDLKALKAQRQTVGGRDATILDFVTTANSKGTLEVDDRVVRSDVTEVGFRLRESDEFPGLLELYRREQFFFDDEPKKGGQYFLVYDRVRSFRIDFFEKPDEGETSSSLAEDEGLEEWDSEEKEGLPHAVKITLVLGTPPELGTNVEEDEREFLFVRWVLLPTGYDEVPEAEPGGDGDGQNPPGPR